MASGRIDVCWHRASFCPSTHSTHSTSSGLTGSEKASSPGLYQGQARKKGDVRKIISFYICIGNIAWGMGNDPWSGHVN